MYINVYCRGLKNFLEEINARIRESQHLIYTTESFMGTTSVFLYSYGNPLNKMERFFSMAITFSVPSLRKLCLQ